MTVWIVAVATTALAVSCLLTLLIKRAAWVVGLIDVPNERSSHAVPTPTGGGLAIVISATAALGLLTLAGIIPPRLLLALGPGGLAVAAVGLIDDRKSLSARIRLFVHFMAAAWAVICIGPVDVFHATRGTPALEWLDYAVCTVGIVWFLNMFNFMDGIDAIAASEAVFLGSGTALLALYSVGLSYIAAPAVVIAATSAGFLIWNWPPAKTFMGDVGSGYLGFVFAVMGLASGSRSGSALYAALILAGIFAVDSTFTLVRRFVRGERITDAHRTHAFQLLAQRVGHRKATLSVAAINLAWLLPCAVASALWPQDALWITVLALSPLALCAFAIGAGRAQALPVSQVSPAVIIQFPSRKAFKPRRAKASGERHGAANRFSGPPVSDRTVNDIGG